MNDTLDNDAWQERLETALAGDQEALGMVCQHYLRPKVYALTLKILKNPHDAEDIVQDTFARLLTHQQNIRKQTLAGFEAFVIGIAKNACIDLIRKRKQTEPLAEDVQSEVTTQHEFAHQEIIQILRGDLFEHCTTEEREIFRLRAVEEWTFREISERLRIGLTTIYHRYDRVLETLRLNTTLRAYWEEIKA